MLPPDRELVALRFLDRLESHLQQANDPQHIARFVLRETRDLLGADTACLAVTRVREPGAHIAFVVPQSDGWDLDLLERFMQSERPPRPDDLLLVPLKRRGDTWAALAFSRPGRPYERHERRLVTRIAETASAATQRIDRDRILEVRDRIDRKIREQLHPKDLFYQILDGLRSLTRYDHSSALLIRDSRDGGGALPANTMAIAAEQIAWTKAKSARIGQRLRLTSDVQRALDAGAIQGFDRRAGRWQAWTDGSSGFLADWLDFGEGLDALEEREHSILCAPLVGRDGVFGVIKVASRHAGRLTRYDAGLVERFLPQAAQAIDSLTHAQSLQARLLTAERRHAMAELARGVSHDVNNALGAMLPLVQQMRDEVTRGEIDRTLLQSDLDQVQRSLEVCRRIFGGMLAFARGGTRRTQSGRVPAAVETTLAILKNSLDRRGIALAVDLPDDDVLPPVACAQSDLEQVLLNLLSNARDACSPGQRVTLTATLTSTGVDLVIADTGPGIAAEHMARVQEPFFTTKPGGNGLGLTICRSILWEAGGRLTIDSAVGQGTRVTAALPRASAVATPVPA
jgi:signal transduction histidine kinase